MGWRLAEEVAWARPERPGPEWWTLMDIAQDARDDTRRSMCGLEYLMDRGKCSKATLFRRMKVLTDAGLVVVARHSAPGIRAIYEIPVIHSEPVTGLSISETRSGLSVSETRTGLSVSETRTGLTALTDHSTGLIFEGNRSQNRPEHVSAFVRHTPSDTPSLNPVTTVVAVDDSNVEITTACGQTQNPGFVNGHHLPIEAAALRALGRTSTEATP